MTRKVISILMFGCILCFSACNKSQISAIHPDTLREPQLTITEERLENERKAMEQLNRLCENFAVETGQKDGSVYTDYCGGVYLSKEGNLVVCVTKDYDLDSGLIEKYTENEDIIFQVVEYPYYVLEEEREYILRQYERLREAFDNGMEKEVCGSVSVARVKDLLECTNDWGIYEDANRVIVAIRDLDEEKIETFRSVISDKEIVDFEMGGYFSY